jgi:nicotinate-nucleotide--dimethylbenzimidazole phosphoribosyltransferase
MSEVIRHVVGSIGPASRAHAEAVRGKFAAANLEVLARLAGMLGGAQHTAAPRVSRRTVVVVAGDHGAGDPGIALGASHPTVIAASAIASGSAALASMARANRAPIVIVDAGVAEPAAMPASTIALGRGPTRDLLREPAMTVIDATLGLEAGIALAISLSEPGLDVLVLGALGLGSDLAAAAIAGTLHPSVATSPDFPLVDDPGEVRALGTAPDWSLAPERGLGTLVEPDVSRAYQQGRAWRGSGLELLATFGGPETCVLAGLILGAASLHVPVILDGHATGAAAVVAMRLAPDVSDYLVASHGGAPVHARLLTQLGLAPIFDVGLGHGEGIGAAMLLPWLDQVEAFIAPR